MVNNGRAERRGKRWRGYGEARRRDGYRSRSAYKLLALDEKYGLLGARRRIVDLGSAPGGWLQVAAARCAGGRVVGADEAEVEEVEGAIVLQMDATASEATQRILEALGGEADVVLSDMATSSTGVRSVDRLRSEALGEAALMVAQGVLREGGALVMKALRGAEGSLSGAARGVFEKVERYRPEASLGSGSTESYVVCLGRRADLDL